VLFLGALNFNFLIKLMFLYQYSRKLEEGFFEGRRADFVFMLTFLWGVMMVRTGASRTESTTC
jgi:hypothetical protein